MTPHEHPAHTGRLRRIGLGALTAVLTVNLWTGSPLFAIWLGSRVQRQLTAPSMTAVFVVLVALIVQSVVIVRILAVLSRSYDEALGREPQRYQAPWLKSMRAERDQATREKRPLTVVERMVVISVVLGVAAFEVWFFLLAGSSLPRT